VGSGSRLKRCEKQFQHVPKQAGTCLGEIAQGYSCSLKRINVASKIAWGVAGAGHFLPEVAQLLETIADVDLFVSRAAEEVIKSYRLQSILSGGIHRVLYDRVASAPEVNKLYLGRYRLAVIAPATSNSVAKFVCGISDSLLSNLFAHAGKARIPILVLPTDIAPEMSSEAPGGVVQVYPRTIDLENIRRLEAFEGVTVLKDIESLQRCLNTYL
jgi:dihydromethanopterin reductase (acceptor)